MADYTVIKRDANGKAELSYTGTVVDRGANCVCIDAIFGFSDRDLGYINLRKGDHFREWFYSDRWFNIFRVQDVDDGQLKGWYCNITRPAEIADTQVAADDLALDVFVYPDGRTLLLDEDEFSDLILSESDQRSAKNAVDTIMTMVSNRDYPFDEIMSQNS